MSQKRKKIRAAPRQFFWGVPLKWGKFSFLVKNSKFAPWKGALSLLKKELMSGWKNFP